MVEPIFSNNDSIEHIFRNIFHPAVDMTDDGWVEIIKKEGTPVSVVRRERVVLFKKLEPAGRVPEMQKAGDAGYDLFCAQEAVIPPNSFVDIDTHIAIEMPKDIYARIVGRSSTLRKRGLLVNEGIIDNGFRGSMFVGVFNMTNQEQRVVIGDRFAQILLLPRIAFPWFEVEELSETDRGADGFGSTGMK